MALETFRRFEDYWKKNIIFNYMMEISFWLLQTLILFYLLFVVNNGEVRFYIFLAVLCGFAAYQSLFASYYCRLLERIITSFLALYHFVYQIIDTIIFTPLKWLIQLLFAIFLLIIRLIYWLFWMILRIIYIPISIIVNIFSHFIPKNAKNYLHSLAGIYSKIENSIVTRWKNYWDKGGS
ncbi:spore cortex biosynthesis protein YabQ [Paraliobacillus quinghaiensis]|uniref:Spore cortex biosynthesis protein YabQ n=2 Tax=Paraliobacillus quinghaiensis TaxID=470815 RepID=A0A917TTF2_9BACI|nr:spore cortex biosynthesis protein YabQ [Paraliobacillus quinghaiensis]